MPIIAPPDIDGNLVEIAVGPPPDVIIVSSGSELAEVPDEIPVGSDRSEIDENDANLHFEELFGRKFYI